MIWLEKTGREWFISCRVEAVEAQKSSPYFVNNTHLSSCPDFQVLVVNAELYGILVNICSYDCVGKLRFSFKMKLILAR